MDGFYEIRYPSGAVIQCIAALSATEIVRLEANGYQVVKRTLSRELWRWLLQPPVED